jgi:hypothetical protein
VSERAAVAQKRATTNTAQFLLTEDRRGMLWDLLLYVPTVVALLSMAAKFWYGEDTNYAYLFAFLASFFAIAGVNRILKTRLMLLPTSPVAIEVGKNAATLTLRRGDRIELVGELRFYTDYAGKSFGLAGLNKSGQRLQYVFHRGQFADPRDYDAIKDALRRTIPS